MEKQKKLLLVKCLDPKRRDVYAFKQIPLGIAYLAAATKEQCDLEVFDMLVDDGLLDRIHQDKPDIIGLSIFSVDFVFAKELIKNIRQISPKSIIVAGGAHATVAPLQTLEAGVDMVVRSEGEQAISEILTGLREDDPDFKKIAGVSCFDASQVGGICHNPIIFEENIDNLPMPAIEIFDFAKYDQFPLLTSRGCPFACKFCASKTIWGQRVRFHSAERIFTEIKRAVEDYGFSRLVFIDDTFTLNHKRLAEICDRIIESSWNITWAANSRVDTIDYAVAEKISKAGCKVISFGIESGSELIQESVGKKLKIEQMKKAVNACREFGIRVKTGWMVGLPGDYNEQMKSLDVMLELEPDEISIHHFIPMPGTAYWNRPEVYGISFNKEALLQNFSIDALPNETGLNLNYLSNEEAKEIVEIIVRELRSAGYKSPAEISEHTLKVKIVKTYMDRKRPSVLPSER